MKPDEARPSILMKPKLVAPCGMNCALCYAHLREKNICPGCLGDDRLKAKTCAACRIKNCPQRLSGNLRYCFECAEYPCALIKHIDKRYRAKYAMSMVENLETIRNLGIRKFISREREKWTCPKCGSVLSVHKPTCLFCGSSWREE